ncbi:MAG: CsgG/HfaB family protein [Candidatus Firestonebacteria bacterium]
MKKLLLLSVCMLVLFGCAEERNLVKSPFGGPDALKCQAEGYNTFANLPYGYLRTQQVERLPFPGFLVVDLEGKVVVENIIGGENLQKELRREDQVVLLNNKAVSNKKQFLSLVRDTRFDDIAFITFKRNGSEFTLAVRMNEMRVSKLYTGFEKKLLEGKKVGIAIIPGANTATTDRNLNLAGLVENDKNFICSAYEKMFLDEYSSYSGFSVIDRNMLEKVVAEQKLQVSGAVDDETIQKLGRITGASHLFFITMSRYEDSTNFVERLIEVETAKVVYSDNYTYVKPKQKTVVVKEERKRGKEDRDNKEKDDKNITININNINTNVNTNTNTNNNSK